MSFHQLIQGQEKSLDGTPIRRVLPVARQRHVGPFVFLDHMGPVEFSSTNSMVVRSHPHIGLSTLTYLFEGAIRHRDSIGNDLVIRPGEVNWMTAGHGIAHSERALAESQMNRLEGLQFWVAQPREKEESAPSFQHLSSEQIPVIEEDRWSLTLVAGEAQGQRSPLQVDSPLIFADIKVKQDCTWTWDSGTFEIGLYAIEKPMKVNGQVVDRYQLITFHPGTKIEAQVSTGARFVLLGGVPHPEARLMWWNFVASRKELILQAQKRWAAGEFAAVPGETERIPLPEGPPLRES